MDRMLVLNAQLAIAQDHRLEVTEYADDLTGERVVLSVTDLDAGVVYHLAEQPRGEVVRWRGRIRACTVTVGGRAVQTTLNVEADGVQESGSKTALREADAAASAAKEEADRWGGADRPPPVETERFW